MSIKTKTFLKAIVTAQLIACCTLAYANQSPWQFRLRGIDFVPSTSSSTINIVGGAKVTNISSEFVPEFDISYYFTPNVAAELILATTHHTVKATGTVVGDVNLGSVNLLPPTLTLQYHFLPNYIINPYVGAGLNYTYFYNANSGPGLGSISYSNSFGPALQAGIDFALNKNWSINLDVKKVFIQTTAHVKAGGSTLTTDVNINPVIYGLGVGYRF
jgi:outer membrane protein